MIFQFTSYTVCFKFLQNINKNRAFFVTRTKSNTQYRIIKRQPKTHDGIKADWIVTFSSYKAKDYSEKLRVVRYYDSETKKTYEFISNNFKLSAMIAYLLTEYLRFKSRTSFSLLKTFGILSENILFSSDLFELLMKKYKKSFCDLQLSWEF